MVKARENTAAHNVHQYLVVGRATPTEKNPSPKIYKMRIFANDSVRAKSKFWYFLKRLNKIRKVVGEILSVNEIFEKDPSKVKTYGIVCTYKSKFGYHTLYKEFRSTTLNGAVAQLYSEMAGRHKAQRESLVIIRTTEVTGDVVENAKRTYTTQVAKEGIKFPLLQRKLRPAKKTFKTVFKASRPNLFA
jgi:large subunit ribosomal protein L18Ae